MSSTKKRTPKKAAKKPAPLITGLPLSPREARRLLELLSLHGQQRQQEIAESQHRWEEQDSRLEEWSRSSQQRRERTIRLLDRDGTPPSGDTSPPALSLPGQRPRSFNEIKAFVEEAQRKALAEIEAEEVARSRPFQDAITKADEALLDRVAAGCDIGRVLGPLNGTLRCFIIVGALASDRELVTRLERISKASE